jgi:hypothetical protein
MPMAAPFKSLNESKAKTKLEMKALIPYVGKWIGESYSEVGGGRASSMVCTYKTDFMMDSVYLVVNSSCKAKDNGEEVESKWAYTFDAIKGKFRLWGFGPTGIVLEYEGKLTGRRMVWNMLPGQYKFHGDMLEEIAGDSLKTAGQNYTPTGKLLEKSSGIFRKIK